MQELVHAHAIHREGGVLPGLLVHLNLPEPTLQIHAREVSGAHHAFHGFLHAWQGIGILFGPGVQATEVDTEPKQSIFFSHEHNSIAPGRLRGPEALPSSISCICWHTSSTKGGATRRNLSLNGSSFISSMTCLVALVHPISFGSKEKTWWNSSNKAFARLASSGGQSFRRSNPPSFSRAARRSSCLCCVDSFVGSGLSPPSSPNFLAGQANIELLVPHWLQPLGRSPFLWLSEWVGQ